MAARSFCLLSEDYLRSSEEGPPRLQLRPPPSRLRRGHLLPRGRLRIGQVETSPFKRARANQGPARRPIQTRAAAGLALPPPGHGRGAGAGEPAASVTGEQHRRLGLLAVLAGRSGAAMERSLHRVSLGSRRAHPDLSFYLTTFGKCPRRLAARAASPSSQRPGKGRPHPPHRDRCGWQQRVPRGASGPGGSG